MRKKKNLPSQDAGFGIRYTTLNPFGQTTVKTDFGHHPCARIYVWRGLIREIQPKPGPIHCLNSDFKQTLPARWCAARSGWGLCCTVWWGQMTDLPGPALWTPPAVAWTGCDSAADVCHRRREGCGCTLHWFWRTPPWKAASPVHRHVQQGLPPWNWCSVLFERIQLRT